MRSWGRGAFALLLVALSSCSPWTVRPIQEGDSAPNSSQAAANPVAYVDSIWASKLVPALVNSATDARTLLDALAASPDGAGAKYGHREGSGVWYFAVKGQARVLSVDTRSRNGLLMADVAPFDGRPDLSIQIGPVLRGSALRDVTGLIRFTDFANQLQFADVENELNNRVLKTVLGSLDAKALQGRLVRFAGAFSAEGAGEPPIRGVMPLQLAAEERR